MKYVMGLDVSLNRTGLIVLGTFGVIDIKVISSTVRTEGGKRQKKVKLKGLQRQIHALNIIEDILDKYPIQSVGIESYSYASKGNSLYQIGELGGMIRYILWRRNIPYQVFAPQTVKNFLIGHLEHLKRKRGKLTDKEKSIQRKASKEAMVKEAMKQMVVEVPFLIEDGQFGDDEADAYSIAKLKFGIEAFRGKKPTPRYGPLDFNKNQRRVIKKWTKEQEEQDKIFNVTDLI